MGKVLSGNWNKTSVNDILKSADGSFYISYNPGINLLGISLFSADDNSDETALVKDGKFLILNGDFRKMYEASIDSYEKCLEIFKAHEEFKSSWSN